MLPDTGAADLAVLATRKANGAVFAVTRDSASGALRSNVAFGTAFRPVDLEIQPAGGLDHVVMLGVLHGGTAFTVTRDATTGALVSAVGWSDQFRVADLEIVDPDGAAFQGVLDSRLSNGNRFVQVRHPATGALVVNAIM